MEVLQSPAETQPVCTNSDISQEELLKLESMEFSLETNNSNHVENIQVLVPRTVINTNNMDTLPDVSTLQNQGTTSSLSMVKNSTNTVQENDDAVFVSMIKLTSKRSFKKYGSLRACNICGALFNKSKLFKHKAKFHQNELKTKTEAANLHYVKRENEESDNTNSAEIGQQWYSCNVCSGNLKNKKRMQSHIKKFHPEQNPKTSYVVAICKEKMFGCGRCCAMFPNKYIVKQHMEKFHSKEVARKENIGSTMFKQLYRCDVCSGKFRKEKSVSRHKNYFHFKNIC